MSVMYSVSGCQSSTAAVWNVIIGNLIEGIFFLRGCMVVKWSRKFGILQKLVFEGKMYV